MNKDGRPNKTFLKDCLKDFCFCCCAGCLFAVAVIIVDVMLAFTII